MRMFGFYIKKKLPKFYFHKLSDQQHPLLGEPFLTFLFFLNLFLEISRTRILRKQNCKICSVVGNNPVYCCSGLYKYSMVKNRKTIVDLWSRINKSILLNTGQLFFINSACIYCNGSLQRPLTAFGFLLSLGGSTDPFGGFADFSSAAATASFPSSQGRINLQIKMLFKVRERGRDATCCY